MGMALAYVLTMMHDPRRRSGWLSLSFALALALPAHATHVSIASDIEQHHRSTRTALEPISAKRVIPDTLIAMLEESGDTAAGAFDVVPSAETQIDAADLDRLLAGRNAAASDDPSGSGGDPSQGGAGAQGEERREREDSLTSEGRGREERSHHKREAQLVRSNALETVND